jgi:hypothetical protein
MIIILNYSKNNLMINSYLGMFYKLKKQRAAAPLPSRGGAGVGSVTFLLTEHY